jgi:hypothetical protein
VRIHSGTRAHDIERSEEKDRDRRMTGRRVDYLK